MISLLKSKQAVCYHPLQELFEFSTEPNLPSFVVITTTSTSFLLINKMKTQKKNRIINFKAEAAFVHYLKVKSPGAALLSRAKRMGTKIFVDQNWIFMKSEQN